MMTMHYSQEEIDRANQTDLVSFLQSQGEQLVRSGREYRWKRHDSLTVRGNKWFRHSQSKGGLPIDFVMEFYGKSFPEAVQMLTGEGGKMRTAAPSDFNCGAAPRCLPTAPPKEPVAPLNHCTTEPPSPEFRLPTPSPSADTARSYLVDTRCIDADVIDYFLATGEIYEEAAHHNAVFVGRDENGHPRYAHQRGTGNDSFRQDVTGSDKAFNFCYRGEGDRLFVFEAPIDLLSFLCLFKKNWQRQSYLSLGGVGEPALLRFLSGRPNIKTVCLCLDSDEAGDTATGRIVERLPEGLTVHRFAPLYKDWNEVLQHRAEIPDRKYMREAVYGLREPPDKQPVSLTPEEPQEPQEQPVKFICIDEGEIQEVDWLWYPYIPFGKVTIVQGNPGEGKSTFAMRLCAACTNRKTIPGMATLEPFNVIYQTSEDGLWDTVKPRLMEADADPKKVFVIDEAKHPELSLGNGLIEAAIRQKGVRLVIFDPVQAYVGANADMNRANEIRPIFRHLADVAERTGCAIMLIGHLNKATGTQSAYRGLGSIDFRAAARSVLLIGRIKDDPNIRVIVHDKSSLAPEGKSIAFCLDPESGFEWMGEYDITADELLSGKGGNTATKTEQAEKLIIDLLADGKEMASEDILKAAAEEGISKRTVQNAKRKMVDILCSRRVGSTWYNFLKKQPPPHPAS